MERIFWYPPLLPFPSSFPSSPSPLSFPLLSLLPPPPPPFLPFPSSFPYPSSPSSPSPPSSPLLSSPLLSSPLLSSPTLSPDNGGSQKKEEDQKTQNAGSDTPLSQQGKGGGKSEKKGKKGKEKGEGRVLFDKVRKKIGEGGEGEVRGKGDKIMCGMFFMLSGTLKQTFSTPSEASATPSQHTHTLIEATV